MLFSNIFFKLEKLYINFKGCFFIFMNDIINKFISINLCTYLRGFESNIFWYGTNQTYINIDYNELS
jgi:hypothetical protein